MSESSGSRRPTALELIADVDSAFKASAWSALRRLYHDDALLCTVAAHERVVGPDELMEIFEALEGTAYSIGETRTVAVDDATVLVSAQIRYPLEQGGLADSHRTWLLTFRDGLVWRTRFYRTEADARSAYAQLGVDLGIEQKGSLPDSGPPSTVGTEARR